jgi:hypothetical protein
MATVHLPQKYQYEAQAILSSLPGETSCVATGSIVEGLGNPHSDVDLYVITNESLPGQITAMGIRESHYVDCEYMKLDVLGKLCDRITGSGWSDICDLRLREIDRFYRIAISVPIRVWEKAADTLARFTKTVGCEVFARYASLRAYEHLAEAACTLGDSPAGSAELMLRECALWDAARRLAIEGEGYPSLKWTGEKAARRYGRGSAAFHSLVDGYMRPDGTPEEQLALLRSRTTVPPGLREMLDLRSFRLADSVRLLDAPGESYLIDRRSSVSRVTGLVARTCRHLAAGDSWGDATAAVAEDTGLQPRELRAAVWRMAKDQRAHEFLVSQ